MIEVSKKDWKLFRERVPQWQERYMEGLAEEYIALLRLPEAGASRFWKLQKRIENDSRHPGVSLELRNSEVIWDIVTFVREGVIAVEELEGFSDELVEEVERIIRHRCPKTENPSEDEKW